MTPPRNLRSDSTCLLSLNVIVLCCKSKAEHFIKGNREFAQRKEPVAIRVRNRRLCQRVHDIPQRIHDLEIIRRGLRWLLIRNSFLRQLSQHLAACSKGIRCFGLRYHSEIPFVQKRVETRKRSQQELLDLRELRWHLAVYHHCKAGIYYLSRQFHVIVSR